MMQPKLKAGNTILLIYLMMLYTDIIYLWMRSYIHNQYQTSTYGFHIHGGNLLHMEVIKALVIEDTRTILKTYQGSKPPR
jgi:hypothetical protein